MGEVLPASVPVTYRCVTSTLPITSDHQKLRILWVRNSDRAWGGQGGSGCPTVEGTFLPWLSMGAALPTGSLCPQAQEGRASQVQHTL